MELKIMNQSEGVAALLNQEPIQSLLGACGVNEERTEAFKATLLAWKQAARAVEQSLIQIKKVKVTRDKALIQARDQTSLLNTTARRVAAYRRETLPVPKHNGKFGIVPRLRWWRALTNAVCGLPVPVRHTFTAYAMSAAALKDVSAAVGKAENLWNHWRQAVAGRKKAVRTKNKMKQQHLAAYSLLKQRLRTGMKKLSHQERLQLGAILKPEATA